MQIDGQEEITKTFKTLNMAVRNRIMRAALKKAGEPIAQAAAHNVASTSPTIANSIGVQMKSYRKGSFHALKIGPTTDPATFRVKEEVNSLTGVKRHRLHKPFKTAHLVELGTQPHNIRIKKGRLRGRLIKHPGAMARPWLMPAREQHGELAKAVFVSTVWKLIEKEVKRQERKKFRESPEGQAQTEARKVARAARIDGKAAKILAAGMPE